MTLKELKSINPMFDDSKLVIQMHDNNSQLPEFYPIIAVEKVTKANYLILKLGEKL